MSTWSELKKWDSKLRLDNASFVLANIMAGTTALMIIYCLRLIEATT